MLNPSEIYQSLQPKLEELDKERIRFYKKVEPSKYLFWIIFTVGGAYVLAIANFSKLHGLAGDVENIPYLIISYGVLVFVSLLFYLITQHLNLSRFKKMFIYDIAPKIIGGMGRSFNYDYEGEVPEKQIKSSLLFAPFDRYHCQDLVTGNIKGAPISFAEIKLIKRHVGNDKQKSSATVFSGIYFRADLKVTFPTDIWITPKKNSVVLDNLGKKKLKVGHDALERYQAFAEDEEMAYKVLQPAVLDRIAALNKKLKQDKITNSVVSYHFSGHNLELAIATKSKFMDPKLGRSIDTLAFIEIQTSLLNALKAILEDLTLV